MRIYNRKDGINFVHDYERRVNRYVSNQQPTVPLRFTPQQAAGYVD